MINNQNSGEVKLTKSVRLTNDPRAPAVRLEPELLPLSYKELKDKVKERRPDIKFNNQYNQIMQMIKKDTDFCQTRYLDPKHKTSTKKDFYAEKAVDILIAKYDEHAANL